MLDKFSLLGKTILVTGASSGIGREISILISKAGGKLIITGRSLENLNETLNLLHGDGHIALTADLTDSESRSNLILQIKNLNGLVNCAGIVKLVPVKFYNEKNIHDITEINYIAPVLLTNDLLKKRIFSSNSSIIFISSTMSVVGISANGIYSGSKAAITAISRVMALELAPKNIRVNSISPGLVQTPLLEGLDQKSELDEHVKRHPLGLGQPEDIAYACVYLLSDASRWVTGSNLIIDGGYTAI